MKICFQCFFLSMLFNLQYLIQEKENEKNFDITRIVF